MNNRRECNISVFKSGSKLQSRVLTLGVKYA